MARRVVELLEERGRDGRRIDEEPLAVVREREKMHLVARLYLCLVIQALAIAVCRQDGRRSQWRRLIRRTTRWLVARLG